jgi:predicted HTH domain antitoxin
MKAPPETVQDWEIEQVFKLRERQPELMAQVIRRLVEEDEDIRWSVVIGAYRDEQINLGKAAELLNLPEIELRQRFIELGIPLRVGPADLAEARAEVEAVRAWLTEETPEGPT